MVVRHVAVKIRVGVILSGNYGEDDSGKYVVIDGKKVYRVNLVGTVMNVYSGNNLMIILDDGTGVVRIKFFDTFPEVSVGDIVRVVGKIRKDDDIYILGETMSKITDPNEELLWRAEASQFAAGGVPAEIVPSSPTEEVLQQKKNLFIEEDVV